MLLVRSTFRRSLNVRELQSIVDYGRSGPSIDPVFSVVIVPQGTAYWTSDSSNSGPRYAWIVYFYIDGVVTGGAKEASNFVRAVRNAW